MWTCDVCNGEVSNIKDGWIEWLDSPNPKGGMGHGLRLVHSHGSSPRPNKCQYSNNDGYIKDVSLSHFHGDDGLMRLLLMIHNGELPTDEVIDMIQRLHINGYEQARMFARDAKAEGVFEPSGPEGFYYQNDIKKIISFSKKQAR